MPADNAPSPQPSDPDPADEPEAPAGVLDNRVDLSGLQDAAEAVRAAVGTVLVGQRRLVDLMLAAILARGHVLIEGVPGVAKTLTARLIARALSIDFTRIQFTPDLMPSDVLGTSVFNPKTTEFSFRHGPVFSNVVLIDEVNRAPAKTQAALFEVMEEGQVSADGQTFDLPRPFVVFATQNPLEHEGTYRLPEAQLDRFLFRIDVGYPSLEEEEAILEGHHEGRGPDAVGEIEPVVSAEALADYRATVREVHASADLRRYIARIARATRNHEALTLGASPRASVGIMNGAKALAALGGRDFVAPEDVQSAARPALRHRLILTPEQEMEGRSTDDVIDRILDRIDVPR
jgi:MoxR-like ATPase